MRHGRHLPKLAIAVGRPTGAHTKPASSTAATVVDALSVKWCSERLARLYMPASPSSCSTTATSSYAPLPICLYRYMLARRLPLLRSMTRALNLVGYMLR